VIRYWQVRRLPYLNRPQRFWDPLKMSDSAFGLVKRFQELYSEFCSTVSVRRFICGCLPGESDGEGQASLSTVTVCRVGEFPHRPSQF
jgi:hypothetical protein